MNSLLHLLSRSTTTVSTSSILSSSFKTTSSVVSTTSPQSSNVYLLNRHLLNNKSGSNTIGSAGGIISYSNRINNNNKNNCIYIAGNYNENQYILKRYSTAAPKTILDNNLSNSNSNNNKGENELQDNDQFSEESDNMISMDSYLDSDGLMSQSNENSPYELMSHQSLFQHFNNTFIVNSKLDFLKFAEYLKLNEYQNYNVMTVALQWIEQNKCLEKEVFIEILSFFRSRGHMKDFQRCIRNMRYIGLEFDISIYNIKLRFYADLGMQKDVINTMREIERQSPRIVPDIHTYYELLRCFNQQRKKVNQFLEDMNRAGIERTEEFNNLVIHILLNRHHVVSEAIARYDEIVRKHQEAGNGSKPSSETYHNFLVGLAHIGRFDLVRHYWREMKSYEVIPNENTVTSIIRSYSEKKDVGSAIEFYLFVVRDYDSYRQSPVVLGCMLHVLLVGKRYEQMTELLDYLENNNLYTLDMYNNALSVFAKYKNDQVCMKLYENLLKKNFKPTIATYTPLIYMAIDQGQVEQCTQWLNIMRENGIPLNEHLSSFSLRFFLRVGAFDLLENMIKEVVNSNILTASSFATILVHYHMLGESKSNQTNYFMKKLMEQEPRFIEIALDQMIEIYLMMDQYEHALEWLEKRITKHFYRRYVSHPFLLFVNYHKVRGEHAEVAFWENKMREHQLEASSEFRLRTFYHMKKYYKPNNNPFGKPNTDLLQRQLKQQLVLENISQHSAQQQNQQQPQQQQSQQKLPESNNSELEDDISLEEVKPKPTSTFRDIVQESPYSFRMRIMTLLRNKMLLQAAREFKVKEETGFLIDGNTYRVMVKAFIGARDHTNAGAYFLKMLELGHAPVVSLVYDLMDLFFSRGQKVYDEFSKTVASLSYKPESFDEVQFSILIKHNLSKTIKDLMASKNSKLLESVSIRNSLIYGLTHRGDLELAQKVALGLINANAKISYISISFLLKCYLERNEIPAILPQLVRYYENNGEQLSINLANLVMLDHLKKGNINEALAELEKITNIDRYTNAHTIPIAMKIYAIKYPVPPMNNLFMWLNIKKLMIKNKISTLTFYPVLFRSLIEAGQPDIVVKYASEPNFFNSQTVDTFKMVLSCCKDDKIIIDLFRSAVKSKLIMDREALDIVKKANESIGDPRINFYKLKDTVPQNMPQPLAENVTNFILENLVEITVKSNI